MKRRWSLAAIGMNLALGLSALGGEEYLAPVERVGEGGAPAAAAAPSVAVPINQGCAQGCDQGCSQCGGCCEIFTPQMIGNDLPTNVYAGTFLDRAPFGYALVPQVQRGAFKVSDNESPRPVDRAFVYYTYFNGVSAPAPFIPAMAHMGAMAPMAPMGGTLRTDVHRETFGFEKTLFNGNASIGVRMNVIQQDGDIQDDDFGDTTIIAKYAFVNRSDLVLSGGLALTVPTGTANAGAFGNPYRSVLFQPFGAFLWNRDRFYVQGFNATIFSTSDNDPQFTTYDIGIGYRLYQTEDCKSGWLSYVIPTGELHANFPFSKEGFANHQEFALPDSAIATLGVHIGLGCKCNLTVGAAAPISGPKLYDVSGIAQVNWSF